MNHKLLSKLKNQAKKVMDRNTRFHDYGHAVEVLENVQKLLKVEGRKKFDKDVLFTAALFHDASSKQNTLEEGTEGAEIAEIILLKIKDFPQEKIKDVKRIIENHSLWGKKKEDEILFETADEMAAFSDLGLLRSFMMYGKANTKIEEAIRGELEYLEKRFNGFKLPEAKKMIERPYKNIKQILENILLQTK